MDTSADTAIAHTPTITSTTATSVVRRRKSMSNECECRLDNDYLTLCDEHKQELENLKNNPPLWAIRARRGKWKSSY